MKKVTNHYKSKTVKKLIKWLFSLFDLLEKLLSAWIFFLILKKFDKNDENEKWNEKVEKNKSNKLKIYIHEIGIAL